MKLSEITKFVQQCEARMNNLNRELIDERAKEQKLKKDYEVVLAKSSHDVGYYLGIVFLLVGLIGTPMFLMNYLDGRQNEGFMLFLENISFFTFIPGGFIGFYVGCFLGVIVNAILDAPYKKRANEYYSIKASVDKSIAELDKKLEEEKLLYKELKEEQDYARKYDIEITGVEDIVNKYMILNTECGKSPFVNEEIGELYEELKQLSDLDKNTAFVIMYDWYECNFWEYNHNIVDTMFELLLLSAEAGYEPAEKNLSIILEEIKECIEQETRHTYYGGGKFDMVRRHSKILAGFGNETAQKLSYLADKKYKEVSVPKVFASDVQRRLDDEERANRKPEYDVELVYIPDNPD